MSGLALVLGAGSNHFVVVPFDGPERYYLAGGALGPVPLIFAADGRLVLWVSRPDFLDPSVFTIDSVDGRRIARVRPRVAQFAPAALNATHSRIAFWTGAEGRPTTQLNWATFDFSGGGAVDQTDGTCSWSPDGRTLAYEKNGQVYTFDVSSRSSKRLLLGHDPSWTPRGRLIAYRDPNGRASLATDTGSALDWPLSTHKVIGSIRWSPDGRYVSLLEALPHPSPTGAAYHLLVARITDGAFVSVKELGIRTDSFYWITEYQRFCTHCAPGEPFN